MQKKTGGKVAENVQISLKINLFCEIQKKILTCASIIILKTQILCASTNSARNIVAKLQY